MRRKILVIDTDAGSELILSLRALGYEVRVWEPGQINGQDAVEGWDAIILRTAESDLSGLRLLGQLRSLRSYPPLIAVIGKDDPDSAATLLECGCDCVLGTVKSPLHIKAWIEALLRRAEMYRKTYEDAETVIRVGDLEIDVLARMVRTPTRSSELTEREMKLLVELARKPGVVCRRAELLENVWGSSSESLTGTLNTHVNRLRTKIEDDYRTPKYLIGVYGVGYRLAIAPAASEVAATEESPVSAVIGESSFS